MTQRILVHFCEDADEGFEAQAHVDGVQFGPLLRAGEMCEVERWWWRRMTVRMMVRAC